MNNLDHAEKNFFAVGRYWGGLNASFRQKDAVCSMHTGVSISDFNWVWNEKPLFAGSADAIEEIKEYYHNLNLRFWWWLYPRGDTPRTRDLLAAAGMDLIAQIPCMVADLDIKALEENIPAQITVSEVKSNKDLPLWADISFRGFQMPERTRDEYNAFVLSFAQSNRRAQKLFLVYVDGNPAATSLLFTDKETAGIYYVATLPEFRNKGLGFHVTLAAMRAAKDAGHKKVILQATPAGEKVYRRIGFQEICRAQIYKLK
ncbi:MAG TPA: GNAT family N-acetyltransferase [Smithellaceae bacterium]|nr:GNAT family N-acetyltransferase [Smithellaceae bacterium]HRS88560.1 GNAT family N-acetyltransferase [Smithellaceae bacterium]HRV25314.1 GNAT family N-acetyltransferase [Smithellaceae bacterium]